MASLAPKRYSMGRLNIRPRTVSRIPTATIITKELPMMASASFSFPLPLSMEHKGAPPMPKRLAKAITMDMMGRQRPSPVRERVAFSGIIPI